jgi:hypothetical protein
MTQCRNPKRLVVAEPKKLLRLLKGMKSRDFSGIKKAKNIKFLADHVKPTQP